VVKVVTRKGIKLPYMGKEKFIELMRAGMGYDRKTGTFFIEDLGRIDQIKAAISSILKDEITLAQTCFICESTFPCSECEYSGICKSRDIPTYCICKTCYSSPQMYQRYVKKTDDLVAALYPKK